MRLAHRLVFTAALLLWCGAAAAQQRVDFPSLDDNGPGQAPTPLAGYLFRPADAARHPALVFLHGCSGMFARNGNILASQRAWAEVMVGHGYVVLAVDSLGPRSHGEMCSQTGFDLAIFRKRPRDAYGALLYLEAQPFVIPDRVGVVGWSQGGAVVLYSIPAVSRGRPSGLPPERDFRAAVAFYPGACSEARHPAGWISRIPLLVLIGGADVWTPAPPCESFIAEAIRHGSSVEMQVYPDAYHAFDAPNLPRRELPQYVTRTGVVPIIATDAAARADAFARVPAFLDRYLTP